MTDKRNDTKKQHKSSEFDPSKYLAAGRAVFLDGGAPGSNGSDSFGLPSTGEHDPKAVTLGNDIALDSVTFGSPGFDMIKQWRAKLFSEMPEITDELPRLLTEYMRQSEGDNDSPYLRRAKALKHVFVKKTPIVQKPLS